MRLGIITMHLLWLVLWSLGTSADNIHGRNLTRYNCSQDFPSENSLCTYYGDSDTNPSEFMCKECSKIRFYDPMDLRIKTTVNDHSNPQLKELNEVRSTFRNNNFPYVHLYEFLYWYITCPLPCKVHYKYAISFFCAFLEGNVIKNIKSCLQGHLSSTMQGNNTVEMVISHLLTFKKQFCPGMGGYSETIANQKRGNADGLPKDDSNETEGMTGKPVVKVALLSIIPGLLSVAVLSEILRRYRNESARKRHDPEVAHSPSDLNLSSVDLESGMDLGSDQDQENWSTSTPDLNSLNQDGDCEECDYMSRPMVSGEAVSMSSGSTDGNYMGVFEVQED